MNIEVGQAKDDDPETAGRQAAQEAAAGVGRPDLVFVFSTPDLAKEAMLSGITDVLDEPVLLGCSTGGELSGAGITTGSIVLMAIESDALDVGTGIGKPISADNRAAGRHAASEALDALDIDTAHVRDLRRGEAGWRDRAPVSFTAFATTLTGNGSEVLRGVQDVVGDGARVTGGLAGDDWALEETYVYHGDEVLTDAIVVAAMDSPHDITHGIRHGLRNTDKQYTVTKSDANVVYELDGTPVANVYEDLYGQKGTVANFIMTKPLGIEVGEEEARLRDPLVINDDGSIVYAAEVQEGSIVHIMESPPDTIIDAARTAAEEAVEAAGNPEQDEIKGVIMHDCVCRWHCLDDDATREHEIAAVKEVVGEDTPIIGWYTYGEIALPRALAGVHNQTLVLQLFTEHE